MNLNQAFINLQKVPAAAKIFLLQNLASMNRAGLPLADALSTLGLQTKNQKLKTILASSEAQIRTGKTFAESLTPYTKDFGEVFINMIAAGEASGSLESILGSLYLQLKKEHALKTKIRNALTYPVIIIVMMFGIGAFVIFFVLPNITAMFVELKAELPLPTRILIGISNFFQSNQFIAIPG